MGLKKLNIKSVSLLILIACIAGAQLAQSADFDVTKYGAQPGGSADIIQALTSAWKDACASTTPAKIIIPRGTFFLSQVSLDGPCKAPIELQIQGTLKGGTDFTKFGKGDGWVTFNHVDQFTMNGGGVFDGEGAPAWSHNDCNKNAKCAKLPTNIRFNFINNTVIRDITSLNSKNFHINVLGCYNITFQHVTITAPGDSPNTDGIHIGRSVGVNITDSNIGTGDDCIAVGDGTEQLWVTNVNCGPGHGISVGSLGKYPNEKNVTGITVRNCTISKTQNGVRVKTWPSAPGVSLVTDMHFEDIIMDHVENPIIVDQEYCPWNQCDKSKPSLVKIRNVSFKNIRGTSATQVAVKLVCSRLNPCNVDISDIDLKYEGVGGPATSQCVNIQPTLKGLLNPPACSQSQ